MLYSFCQNDIYENLRQFSMYNCKCIDSTFMGRSTPTTAFDKLLHLHNVEILNICMKEFICADKIVF